MRVHSGQIVVVEVAAAALAAAAVAGTPVSWLVAAPAAGALLLLGLGRLRHRPLYAWCGAVLRFAARRGRAGRHVVDEVDGVGFVEDAEGLTTVLEVGDPAAPLSEPMTLPPLSDLLAGPGIHVQLIVYGTPAPAGAGIPASSYRQLTEGRVPARVRVLLAVRAVRDDPAQTAADLRPVLRAAVRRVGGRLGVPARPLDAAELTSELRHDEPVRVGWAGLRGAGLHQTSVLLRRWPERCAELVPRLLCLPVTGARASLTAGPKGAQLVVRLAAPDPAPLAVAVAILHRLLAGLGGAATVLYGEQLHGLAATVPLARLRWPDRSARPGATEVPAAGLVLGRDRRGAPVPVRLPGTRPTHAVLAGGVPAAALVAVRALALGTPVLVRTDRPEVWEPLLRGVRTPADTVEVVPPDQVRAAPGLVIVDVTGTPAGAPGPIAAGQTVLVVRERLDASDRDGLSRADLVILQQLPPDEAALAGELLGLGEWLAAIRDDMVGVAAGGRVRWARLSATPIERQVIGAPGRVGVSG